LGKEAEIKEKKYLLLKSFPINRLIRILKWNLISKPNDAGHSRLICVMNINAVCEIKSFTLHKTKNIKR
jgi:hypothetical protein